MIASQGEMCQVVKLQILYQVEIDSRSMQSQGSNLADIELASVILESHVFEGDLESGYCVPKDVGSMVEPERVHSHRSEQILTIIEGQGSFVCHQMIEYLLLDLAWQLREGDHGGGDMGISLEGRRRGRLKSSAQILRHKSLGNWVAPS